MYFCYIDDSGDPGELPASPTKYQCLSAVIVHDTQWAAELDALIAMRRALTAKYGLPFRAEIHCSEMMRGSPDYAGIKKYIRLEIIRAVARHLAQRPALTIMNAVWVKKPNDDRSVWLWERLLQRIQKTLMMGNLPGGHADDRALIVIDGEDPRPRAILRQRRRINIIGEHGNQPLTRILEDPWMRDSSESFFIQAADVAAFALYQRIVPQKYIRDRGAQFTLETMSPVLALKAVYPPLGIIVLR